MDTDFQAVEPFVGAGKQPDGHAAEDDDQAGGKLFVFQKQQGQDDADDTEDDADGNRAQVLDGQDRARQRP